MKDILQNRFELEDESSLLNWYPKIEGKIPTPATEVLNLTDKEHRSLYDLLNGKKLDNKLEIKIHKIAKEMKEPFFLRTDQASGKHEWKDTCFVEDKQKILRHIARVIEFHEMAGIIGIRYKALIFREYLPLQSQFTAFNGMPVAPEWRYFVRDGKVECRHFYWIDDAIVNPSIKNWKPILHGMWRTTSEENILLGDYATIFGRNNPGYWSVDFALTRDKGWILIDAARGEVSWHPAECMFNPDHDELMKEKEKPEPDFEGMLVENEGSDEPV